MVKIDGLSFGYGRGALFSDLTLILAPGNIYGLLGVNGAGKSTLLKLMSGLLFKGRGSVRSLGQDPAARRPSFLLDVFVLAEDAQAPSMSAADYVRARAPFYPRFDHSLFERYLREFELPAEPAQLAALSHGQQKKFLLAFGLASHARLVLLDEPMNGLDIPSKSLLRRVIAEAVSPERLFVISTHQVRDLGTLMDPIVILHQGRVLLNSTLAEIGARIHMTQHASPPALTEPDLLFSEPTVGGFWSIRRGGGDGPLDLEVLFNAIVAKPELAQSVLAAAGGAA
jgi:ABC-2 type transport system ATP-binding protein